MANVLARSEAVFMISESKIYFAALLCKLAWLDIIEAVTLWHPKPEIALNSMIDKTASLSLSPLLRDSVTAVINKTSPRYDSFSNETSGTSLNKSVVVIVFISPFLGLRLIH